MLCASLNRKVICLIYIGCLSMKWSIKWNFPKASSYRYMQIMHVIVLYPFCIIASPCVYGIQLHFTRCLALSQLCWELTVHSTFCRCRFCHPPGGEYGQTKLDVLRGRSRGKSQSPFKTTEVKFKLNEEFDETAADDRKTKVGHSSLVSSPFEGIYYCELLI